MTDDELLARLADSHLEGERQAAAAIERLISERDEALARAASPPMRMMDFNAVVADGADLLARAEKAEAEVERLRGVLRRAGAALWETGNEHQILQDIDDALPPGWLEDTP